MASNKLLHNGTVISYDQGNDCLEIFQNASILIKDGLIASITDHDIRGSVPTNTEVIDVSGKIVSPGFIDTHRHSWFTAYRTLGADSTLASYFTWLSYMSPEARRPFSAEDIYDSTLAGLYEAVNGGVTTILEHAQTNWSPDVMKRGLEACHDSGVRMSWCYNLHEHEDLSVEQQASVLKELIADQRQNKGKLLDMGLAWDSIGFDDASSVEMKKRLIKDLGLNALTTHCMTGPWGTDHANTVENADKHGLLDLNVPFVFSHAGYISEQGKAILRDKNHFISATPESELHYGHGHSTCFDIPDKTSIGLDVPFVLSGDMLNQARVWLGLTRSNMFNETLAKGLIPKNNPMKVEEAFLMATRQGALALRQEDLGVLSVGAKADVVVFEGDSPNMAGWQNPVSAIIMHANVSDITHVLINGEWKKRDGQLVMKEPWAQLLARVKPLAARAQEANKNPPKMLDSVWGKPLSDVEIISVKKTS